MPPRCLRRMNGFVGSTQSVCMPAYAEYWLAKARPATGRDVSNSISGACRVNTPAEACGVGKKLLGDVANIRTSHWKLSSGIRQAFAELQGHPCPTVEWKILSALARTHALLKHTG